MACWDGFWWSPLSALKKKKKVDLCCVDVEIFVSPSHTYDQIDCCGSMSPFNKPTNQPSSLSFPPPSSCIGCCSEPTHTHTHLYTHSTMMWAPISPSYSSLSGVLIMSQWPFHITPHLSFFIFSFQPPSFPRTPLFNPSHISFLCITSFFWSVLEHNGLTLHLNPIAILISITLTCRCTLLSTSFLSQFWSGITIVGIYQVMKVINKPLLPNQNRSKNQFSNWNRVECRPFDTMWRFVTVSIFLIHFNANCSPPISHNSNLDGVSEIFMSSLQLFLHNSLSNNI